MKTSRSRLTAPPSHLRLLIPPLFHLLILLFLRSLLSLLPSAAEAVQAAEAGAGERHGLPVAPHRRGSAGGTKSRRHVSGALLRPPLMRKGCLSEMVLQSNAKVSPLCYLLQTGYFIKPLLHSGFKVSLRCFFFIRIKPH